MRKSLLIIAVLCLAVGACGSSSKSYGSPSSSSSSSSSPDSAASAAPTTTTAGTAAPTVMTVHLSNYSFSPSTITAKAGSTVTLKLVNPTSTPHNFSVESLKVNTDVDAGKTVSVDVKMPAASSVPFFCEYHQARGMTGQLKVIAT